MSQALQDRDIRQRQIVPPAALAACRVMVIGVGAIGRQVALQLAAVGIPAMDLVDDDVVAVENLAAQGYWPEDLGQAKVEVTGRLCRSVYPELQLQVHAQRFGRASAKTLPLFEDRTRRRVIFCCVDHIGTRKLIWGSVRSKVQLFVDGRMSAEVMRVLAIENPATDSYYAGTLFEQAQAYGDACTARSTVYTASIAAGLMLSAFTKWLRRLPVDRDLSLNLLAAELGVG